MAGLSPRSKRNRQMGADLRVGSFIKKMQSKVKEKETACIMPCAVKGFSFNDDRSYVAVIGSTNDVIIFKVDLAVEPKKWEPVDRLRAHDLTVASVHWHGERNRIVTCSEDCTALVWEQVDEEDGEGKRWDTVLVQLGLRCKGNLCARWSPNGLKCFVGSVSRLGFICHFEPGNGWWTSKEAKCATSSITCAEWIDDQVFACGSTDNVLRIVSAYIKSLDKGVEPKGKAGTVLAEYQCGGWVRALSRSPDGNTLVAVTHNSCVSFVDLTKELGDPGAVSMIRTQLLPFFAVRFVADDICVAAGNDFFPVCYRRTGDGWIEAGRWMEGKESKKGAQSPTNKAMAMFQEVEKFGGKKAAAPKTKHVNAITTIEVLTYGDRFSFITGGLDACMYVWESSSMQKTG